jgi:hypothetical protein
VTSDELLNDLPQSGKPPFSLLDPVVTEVDRDTVNPGRQRPVYVHPINVRVDSHKALLEDVLGSALITGDGQGSPIDRTFVFLVQGFKSGKVTLSNPRDQLTVLAGRHGSLLHLQTNLLSPVIQGSRAKGSSVGKLSGPYFISPITRHEKKRALGPN